MPKKIDLQKHQDFPSGLQGTPPSMATATQAEEASAPTVAPQAANALATASRRPAPPAESAPLEGPRWEVIACDFVTDPNYESVVIRFRRQRCSDGPSEIFKGVAAAVEAVPEVYATRTRLFQAERDLREARSLAEKATWAVDDLLRSFRPEARPVLERAALVAEHEHRLAELRAARGHAETVVAMAEQARDAAKKALANVVRSAIAALHPGDQAERQKSIDLLLRRLALGLSATPDIHGRPTPGVLDQLFDQMFARRYLAVMPGHVLDEQVAGILGTFVELS